MEKSGLSIEGRSDRPSRRPTHEKRIRLYSLNEVIAEKRKAQEEGFELGVKAVLEMLFEEAPRTLSMIVDFDELPVPKGERIKDPAKYAALVRGFLKQLESRLQSAGCEFLGGARGDQVVYDLEEHRTLEAGLKPGDRVRIVNRGVRYKGKWLSKTLVVSEGEWVKIFNREDRVF